MRHHVSKYCLEWQEAKDFILWAEKNGYIGGAKLRRHKESAPYSPKNCCWNIVPECSTPCPERLRYWDETVERIRAEFGGRSEIEVTE